MKDTATQDPQPLLAEETLDAIRSSDKEGRWAIYRNEDLSSSNIGHVLCLIIGPGNTFEYPPVHAPDGAHGLGWRYRFAGWLDKETGNLVSEVAEVIVGNIGTVYRGTDHGQAHADFETYVEQSRSEVGRAAGESVILFVDGEPVREHAGQYDD